MFIRDVRRSGRWCPASGCILEHQIFRFVKMILRDGCSTSYDLAWLLCGRRSTLHRWSGNIAKLIGTRPSALHSTFHFWTKSCRIASFLMLPTSKIHYATPNTPHHNCNCNYSYTTLCTLHYNYRNKEGGRYTIQNMLYMMYSIVSSLH